MRKWWKNPKIVGKAAYWLLRILKLTMRITIHKHASIDHQTPYLFAFWHGKQFLPAAMVTDMHKTPMCAMTSPSRDGAILAVMLQNLGYDVIRGSSRDGGMRALLAMKKLLDSGTSVGFGIDGPIGPIHVIKPGIAYLAQKCQVKIIPVGCGFSRYWTFNKAWDKFELPKPFSRGVLVLGEPITVNVDADIKEVCLNLEQIMHQTEQAAIQKLN